MISSLVSGSTVNARVFVSRMSRVGVPTRTCATAHVCLCRGVPCVKKFSKSRHRLSSNRLFYSESCNWFKKSIVDHQKFLKITKILGVIRPFLAFLHALHTNSVQYFTKKGWYWFIFVVFVFCAEVCVLKTFWKISVPVDKGCIKKTHQHCIFLFKI